MKINEVAKKTGLSVRTLHYYDQIGLLSPSKPEQNGYRDYNDSDLKILQEILFMKELDFSLEEIKEILNKKSASAESFKRQKEILIIKRERLNRLISLLERLEKGENRMNLEAFDNKDYEEAKKEYEEEVRKRYGDTKAYAESKAKTKDYDQKKWNEVNEEMDSFFIKFGAHRNETSISGEVIELVKAYQAYITANFYTCTDEILLGLGEMYVSDPRFMANIDKAGGEGTAKFIKMAIEKYLLD